MIQEDFYEDLLGFSDLKVTSIEKTVSKYIFYCELKSSVAKCPNCLKQTSQVNQTEPHKVQDLKISEREVLLSLKIKQFYCSDFHRYFLDNPKWIRKKLYQTTIHMDI